MKPRIVLPILLLLTLFRLFALPTVAIAQAGANDRITIVPASLALVRTLPGDSVAASLRIHVSESISNVTLLVSDFQGTGNDGEVLDPIPATNINILPALQFSSLPANSITQLTLQLAPPATVGIYSGTLLIRWQEPEVGEASVPIRLQLRTKPELVVHDPADNAGVQIAVTRGTWISGSTVERRLILREKSGGATISELYALQSDLLDATNHQSLSGKLLQVALAATDVAPGDLMTATVAADLSDAPAGDFKGNLTLVAKPNILLTVPVEIQVRHHWYLALLVLGVGVALGLSLSNYQSRGRLRDEFVVRIANLREALKEDAELKKGFGDRLEQLLVDVDVAIRTARWRDAEAKMSEAENLVTKWRKDAEDWKNQLDYLRTPVISRLQAKLAEYPDVNLAPPTVRALRQAAEDLLKSAVDCESPLDLRSKIAALEGKMHSFERVESAFRSLSALRMEFDSAKVEANTLNSWLDVEQNLRSELFTTALDNDALNTLASKIAAQLLVLTQYKEAHPDQVLVLPAATSAPAQEEAAPDTTLHLPGIASARAFDPRRARRRLGGNAWLLYILSAIVLISVGMSTLYAPNVTFGANPLSDYFSIFIFGLGAQTTLASATDLLQRWGVPFTRVNP